jgi:hypothetical protein
VSSGAHLYLLPGSALFPSFLSSEHTASVLSSPTNFDIIDCCAQPTHRHPTQCHNLIGINSTWPIYSRLPQLSTRLRVQRKEGIPVSFPFSTFSERHPITFRPSTAPPRTRQFHRHHAIEVCGVGSDASATTTNDRSTEDRPTPNARLASVLAAEVPKSTPLWPMMLTWPWHSTRRGDARAVRPS